MVMVQVNRVIVTMAQANAAVDEAQAIATGGE